MRGTLDNQSATLNLPLPYHCGMYVYMWPIFKGCSCPCGSCQVPIYHNKAVWLTANIDY